MLVMLMEHLVHIMILPMLCLDVSGVVNDVVLHSMLPSYCIVYHLDSIEIGIHVLEGYKELLR